MSEVAAVLTSFPRVYFACRTRGRTDPTSGRLLSDHQARILEYLDPIDPAMVGELAEYLGVTASTMSITLKRMEEAGFISRSRDPDDRRVMNVTLTEDGERMRASRTMLDPDRVHRLLYQLHPERRAAALAGLRILAEAAERMVRAGGPISSNGRDSG